MSADRITTLWKTTIGGNLDYTSETFDLDQDEPFRSVRRERQLRWVVVRGLGEHWSVGATGHLRSSTFDNTALAVDAAPAIEWNFFPYSAYTRRQLRVLYGIGGRYARYYEETLFLRTRDRLARQELSATYEQREPWGSIETRAEWSNFLPGFSRYRLALDGEASVRIARGLSITGEVGTSRIRDQIALPRRGATPEEVLLRIRRLRSGYEAELAIGVTYQFGSRFASVVNPRFGR